MPSDWHTYCMEIPDLVRQELGGEEVLAGVPIGDEDVVCATAARTLVYRSEGLLSDERIDAYPHNAERLQLSDGRRKTKFTLTYVDGSKSFSVPSGHARDVLTLLLEGILGASGVLAEEESVVGAFRFSELTLVIAEEQLIRHIGQTVWDADFETYPYEDLTGLDFQQGSVATEIVVSIGGRPQRIKTPREDARLVEETLKKAIFEYYDVVSMDELESVVSVDPEDDDDSARSDDLTLGSALDPLVTGDSNEAAPDEGDAVETEASGFDDGITGAEYGGVDTTRPIEDRPSDDDRTAETADFDHVRQATIDALETDLATQDEVEALGERIEDLTEAVERQNQLLETQHNAIAELVDQLRSR